LIVAPLPVLDSFAPTDQGVSSFPQTDADCSASAVAPSFPLTDLDQSQSVSATGSNSATVVEHPEGRGRRRTTSRSAVASTPIRRSSRTPVPSRRLSPSISSTDPDSLSAVAITRADRRYNLRAQVRSRSGESSIDRRERDATAHIRAHAAETAEQREARLQNVRESVAAVRFVPAPGAYVSGRPSAEQLRNP
jgi:hypothetical protein